MRSFTNLAVLATSLLVKEVVAGRYDVRKRDYYVEVDEVVVTAEVVVTDMGGGVYHTGGADYIGTATVDGTAVLVTESISSSTSTTSTPEAVPTSTTPQAAVFIETSSTSVPAVVVTPTPTPTSTTPAPVPTTSTTALVVAAAAAPVVPTTLVQVVASSKTTSAAAVVATTASSSSSSAKRGVAYNNAALTDAFANAGLVSWAYNWGSDAGGTILSTLEYVPLLWGMSSDHTGNWVKKATAAIASGSKHLLAFNEPDYSGQANLSPAAAASGYLEFMQPFAGQAKLGSPAITNGGGSMGLTWLTSFMSQCSSCTIDFVAIHWYNGGTAADFETYIKSAYAAGGNRPLWITEFQASGSVSEQQAFLASVLPFLDASPMVDRYAYFMAADGNLISGTGLSALGSTYATAA